MDGVRFNSKLDGQISAFGRVGTAVDRKEGCVGDRRSRRVFFPDSSGNLKE
jgi:hypothetical protein